MIPTAKCCSLILAAKLSREDGDARAARLGLTIFAHVNSLTFRSFDFEALQAAIYCLPRARPSTVLLVRPSSERLPDSEAKASCARRTLRHVCLVVQFTLHDLTSQAPFPSRG